MIDLTNTLSKLEECVQLLDELAAKDITNESIYLSSKANVRLAIFNLTAEPAEVEDE